MKTFIIRLLAILLFALMLLFPADTLSGASTGLLLWFQTVLPTLLPCMIAADFLLRIQADRCLTRILGRPLSLLFGTSRDGAYAILVGFLSGYPMGAKTAASLLTGQRITPSEASYLLSFCNQPSPMFLIGYLCISLLGKYGPHLSPVSLMLAGVYGSAIFISFLYRSLRRMKRRFHTVWGNEEFHTPSESRCGKGFTFPASEKAAQKTADPSLLSLLELSMMTSFEVMVKIGGYMMLFSVLEAFILKLPLSCPAFQSILLGFVEMTTGSRHIAASLTFPWSAAFCCGVTAFGGLSGFAQTANVLKGSGLSVRHYFLWKLLQGCLAVIIVVLLSFLTGAVYP